MGQEEKEDGLVGILSDVLEDEEAIKETLAQILERWNKETTIIDDELKKATVDVSKLDLVGKMNEITQQKIATYTPKEHKEQTEDQRRIKEAILQGSLKVLRDLMKRMRKEGMEEVEAALEDWQPILMQPPVM